MLTVLPQRVVVFDTETTGYAKLNKPSTDPSQAVAVQVSAKLFDMQEGGIYKKVSSLYTIVDRQGVPIDKGAMKVHGITEEMCDEFGMAPENMIWALSDMLYSADLHTAHNLVFDIKIILSTAARAGVKVKRSELFPKEKQFCTMLKSMNLVKATKANGSIKWPSLEEAMQFLLGRGVGESPYEINEDCDVCVTRKYEEKKDAHDADVDVDGCADVLFKLLDIMEK